MGSLRNKLTNTFLAASGRRKMQKRESEPAAPPAAEPDYIDKYLSESHGPGSVRKRTDANIGGRRKQIESQSLSYIGPNATPANERTTAYERYNEGSNPRNTTGTTTTAGNEKQKTSTGSSSPKRRKRHTFILNNQGEVGTLGE